MKYKFIQNDVCINYEYIKLFFVSPLLTVSVIHAGPEEGKKYMEKTLTKHSEIVDSIKELSSGLLDLEAKLQVNK